MGFKANSNDASWIYAYEPKKKQKSMVWDSQF